MAEPGLVRWIFPISTFQGGLAMQRFSSIFSQLLQLFPRIEFANAVKKHRSDYSVKGFSSWGQFVAMLFCQFGRAHSLREICGGLASWKGNSGILGYRILPNVLRCPTPMPIAHGRSIKLSSINCSQSVRQPLPGAAPKRSSVSKTSLSAWIPAL